MEYYVSMEYDEGQTLLERLSRGEEEAYVQVYDRYYNMLCIISCYYVKDRFTAETIVGDVIYKLWKNRSNLSFIQDIRKYLIRAVKNSSINYLDHTRSYRKMKSGLQQKIIAEQYYTDYPLDRLFELELDMLIKNSMDSMPELTRNIFELSRFENLKYKEISERTGLSIDAVKYHIKSALKKLRSDIKVL